MALPIFQRTVVTATGDIVSGAEVAVVLEATGLNADIYADRDGLTPLSNPFFTGADGLAQFYAEQGSYRITATGVSGSVTWRYQELIRASDVTQNTADIATNLSTRNLASVTAYVISQYANGDASRVATISAGLAVASYDYFIYEPDLRVYAKNGATGTFSDPLDFDPVAGTDSGVTGTLGLFQNTQNGVQRVIGSATFTKTSNNIALTGIGRNREIGDVIGITGTTANNKFFTIEFITDNDNVIVNYEHRNQTTQTYNHALENESGIAVVCTLVAKWYSASPGLGQSWCTPTSARNYNTDYNNDTNREIVVRTRGSSTSSSGILQINENTIEIAIGQAFSSGGNVGLIAPINSGSVYAIIPASVSKSQLRERR